MNERFSDDLVLEPKRAPTEGVVIVGFTGTRRGMTQVQRARLAVILDNPRAGITAFHHGDCIGADAEAHALIGDHSSILRVIHPCTLAAMRAHCAGENVETRPPRRPLDRNHDIVRECAWLIACPRESSEVRRSGTWATIRFARKLQRRTTIIYPDGAVGT